MEPLTQGFNSPRVDVLETSTELIAVCEIPGIDKKEDIHIDISDNILIISGNINKWEDIKDEAVHRKERYVGSFSRSVTLPLPVKAEGIKASYRNGLLEVRMPKSQEPRGKEIEIEFN